MEADAVWAQHVAARGTLPVRLAQSVAPTGLSWKPYTPVPGPVAAAGLAGEEGKDDDCCPEFTELCLETDATSRKFKLLHIKKEAQMKDMERDIATLTEEKELYKSRYEALAQYVTAKNTELDAQKKDLQVEVEAYVKASDGKDGDTVELLTKMLAAIPALAIPDERAV